MLAGCAMSTLQLTRYCATHPENADILLVEEDPARNELYAHALRSAGFRVTQRHNGHDALKAILARPPQLVVTDVTLPGIDGFELCRRVRAIEKTASLPAITVAALAEREQRAAAESAGFDSVLTVPCAPIDLLSEIYRALERSAELRARAEALRTKAAALRARSAAALSEGAAAHAASAALGANGAVAGQCTPRLRVEFNRTFVRCRDSGSRAGKARGYGTSPTTYV
jgi:DNA-binding response OmpR family regulator